MHSIRQMPSAAILAEHARTLLKYYSAPQLHSLSSQFTPQAASHLLLNFQFDQSLILNFLNWANNQSFFNLEPKCIALHILTKFRLYNTAQSLAQQLISNDNCQDDVTIVYAIFDSLKSSYHQCNSSSSVFDLLVKSYANLGMIKRALTTINLVNSSGFMLGVLSYNSVLDSMVRSRDPVGTLEELYRELVKSQISPNVYTFNVMIRGFCKQGKLEKALCFFDDMESMGCLPNVVTFNTLVDFYCKTGKIDEAFKVFESMRQKCLRPNLITYNAIINGLCQQGRMEDTRHVLKEMNCMGLVPDRVTYNTLVNGYCKQGNIHQALVLHSEMVKKGVGPNVITYTSLINNMCKAGNLTQAMNLMEQMRERGLRPNEITYATLIEGFSKQGLLGEAYQVLKEMAENGLSPSNVAYNSLINGHCILGRVDEALGVLQDMVVKGFKPDVVSYSTLITWFCRHNNIEKAFRLKQEMTERGVSPDVITYSSLVQGLCGQKKLDQACELVQEMLSSGMSLDMVTYTTLINGYCGRGDLSEALKLHDEMIRKGFLPDIVTYSVLVNGLSKQARTREAKHLLFRLFHEGSVPDNVTYDILMEHCSNAEYKSVVALMKSYCMKGLMNEANRVFESIYERNWKPDEAAYNVIIHGHCRCGNVKKALDLYNEMLHCSFIPNTICVIALIKSLFNEGMTKEMDQVIKDVLISCRLNEAEIAKALVEINHKEGNMDVVFSVLAEMAKDGLLPYSGRTAN